MEQQKRGYSFSTKSSHKTPLWMLIYSDMMTNLTLFFMMAFALTRIEKNLAEDLSRVLKDKIAGQQTIVASETARVKEKELIDKLNGGVLRGNADFEIKEREIKLTLKEPMLLQVESAEILSTSRESLSKIALVLREITNTIVVEGHTDDLPMRKGSNWELSLARAVNIVDFFINVEGLNKNNFMTIGYGEYKPIVPNDTTENRARNRRIEINIIRYEQ